MDNSLVPTLHPWPLRIIKSVQFACVRAWRGHGAHVLARAAPFGLLFRGPAADCITRHIYRLGSHEPVMTRYLLDHVRLAANDVALDIGANLGWYSVVLDRLSAAGARIFAFEPDPSTYQLLLNNLVANRASRVTPVNLALGETPGVAQLNRYRDRNNGRHTLMVGGNTSGGTVQVRVNTLQSFWKENDLGNRRIRFLKIDVEGYEYFVLRGAGELLKNCDCMLLEYAPRSLHDAGLDTRSLLELLKGSGFHLRVFENGHAKPIGFSDLVALDETRDLLLTRQP